MQVSQEQLRALCKLLNVRIVKRHYVKVQNYIASFRIIQQVWNNPKICAGTPVALNFTRNEKMEYEAGYTDLPHALLTKKWLEQELRNWKCIQPSPFVELAEGYQVWFRGCAIGTKLDQGNGGRKGLSFPTTFYNIPPIVFFDANDAVTALKGFVAYALDQLFKKHHYAGIYDRADKGYPILTEIKNILLPK